MNTEEMVNFGAFVAKNAPAMMSGVKQLITQIHSMEEKHAVLVKLPDIKHLEVGLLGCKSKKNIKKAIKIMANKNWEAHNTTFDKKEEIHLAFMVRPSQDIELKKKRDELIQAKVAGMAN